MLPLTAEAADGLDCSSLDLPHDTVREVQVWGDAAQARTGSDTVFLREKAAGGRAACATASGPTGAR